MAPGPLLRRVRTCVLHNSPLENRDCWHWVRSTPVTRMHSSSADTNYTFGNNTVAVGEGGNQSSPGTGDSGTAMEWNHSCQILLKYPTPAIVFGNTTKPSRFAHFWQGAQALAHATRTGIWTSKSGPSMVCFVHFDLEMCFAPQRRALFRHRNF